MEERSQYYVTLKPTKKNGKYAKGMSNIAYVDDPAVEELGIYLQKQDNRIVANEAIQELILDYLSKAGQVKPDHWIEVSEEDYLQAKEVHLTNDPTARESFNDVSKGDGTGQWLVRYKYNGPEDSKNRTFCARILSLGRIYTDEEIKNGLSNPQFGNYSIWDYKGSYGCRHTWKRQIYFEDYEDDEVRKVGFVPSVTSQLDDREATTLNAFLSKDDKMQVVAPLLIPDKPVYRNDEVGKYDMLFSKETINDLRAVAHEAKMFEKKDLFKDTHKGGVAPAYTIDEWVIQDENDKAYTEYGFNINRVPIGSWMVHSQITDKVFWEREIKHNQKHAYSIEALINMTMIELSKVEETVNTKTEIMEKDQIKLPQGEHLIDGKIYIVDEGGSVIEIKEVTDEQEEIIKDAAEGQAEKSEDMEKDEKKSEEMAEDKKEEEMKSDKKEEEMESEKKPEEKMEETDTETETETETEYMTKADGEKLSKQIEEMKEMLAEKEAEKIETEVPEKVVEMSSQKQPMFKGLARFFDNK